MLDTTLAEQACVLARQLHTGQTRRESGLSFFDAHLEPVAIMVSSHYGDSLAVAAAFLHDAPVDIGPHTRDSIGALSPELLRIVDLLTEQGEKEEWEQRKSSYLAHIKEYDARCLLVSLCDKIITGYDFVEEWEQGKFGKRADRICWFYNSLSLEYSYRATTLQVVGYDDLLQELWDISESLNGLLGRGAS